VVLILKDMNFEIENYKNEYYILIRLNSKKKAKINLIIV